MGIFTDNFNAGVSGGGTLAQLFQQTRDRNTQRTLAQQFGQDGDFNALGTGLIGLGQAGQGINAINVPYNREQQALQRDFQNQQFQATQQQNAFQNQLATQSLNLRGEELDYRRDPSNPANIPAPPPKTQWVDPQNPRLGVEPIAGLPQGGGGFSTQLVPAYDENGNLIFVQGSEAGGVRPVEGFTPATRGVKVDRGTHIDVVNPSTGETIRQIRKDNFTPAKDRAGGTAIGKSEAAFELSAGKAIEDANFVSGLIKDALAHRGLDGAVGRFDVLRPDILQSSDAVDFRARLAQLEGSAFLDAFQSLKGGGPITDIEGKKATDAQARLNAAQSEGAMREALREMEQLIQERKSKIQKRLNAPRLPRGTDNGISFSRDSRITPASGDNVPVSEEELQDLLGRY